MTEARATRSYFEGEKYNTTNWRSNWTIRSFSKIVSPTRPDSDPSPNVEEGVGLERHPLYFPSVYAFLCSKESFNWELEVWNVTGESETLDLGLDSRITAKVIGLDIPSPTAQTLRFSETLIPLDHTHQLRANLNNPNSPAYPMGTTGWKYWTEETALLDKTVEVPSNTLGLTDLEAYEKQWEFRCHGRLLDMAVYIE